MAKNKNQKQNIVNKYTELLNESASVFLFGGSLNASTFRELKAKLAKSGKLSLLKNTLFNKAMTEKSIEFQSQGYNNAFFVQGNMITSASVLDKFLTEHEYMVNNVLLGNAVYEGKYLKKIAGLGSEQQVYTKLVSGLASPATVLVRSLQSPMQKLVRVLSQIQK